MNKLSKAFILCGIFYLILGMTVGLAIAASQDFTHRPVHAHLNLMGWVSMMLFGLYYAVNPENCCGKLPRLHFGLSNLGLIVMAPALYLLYAGNPDVEIFAKVGAMSFFISILIFGFIVLRSK